jgi:hypothetical protein
MSPRLRLILFKVIAAILGLAVAIAVVEIGVRLFFSQYHPSGSKERELFCRFDRELGWAPLENITAVHKSHGHSGLVHQNQFGIRGADNMRLERGSAMRRLLVLGDSFVWGFAVGQNELFSSPEVVGPGVEILNLGVSGYGNDQEYLIYLRKGAKFAVDEVILALTPSNDVANNLASEEYGCFKPYFKLEGGKLVLHNDHVREKQLHRAGGWLSRNSRTWSLLGDGTSAIRVVLDHSGNKKGTANAKMKVYGQTNVSKRDRDGVELTVEILKSLRDAVSAQSAEFCVIFLPFKPHVDHRVPVNHPLVPLIETELTRVGIGYRDSYPEFLKAAVAGAHLFNEPDNHFSSEGHALFAKFLTGADDAKFSGN